jgi:hypothetical protein
MVLVQFDILSKYFQFGVDQNQLLYMTLWNIGLYEHEKSRLKSLNILMTSEFFLFWIENILKVYQIVLEVYYTGWGKWSVALYHCCLNVGMLLEIYQNGVLKWG